MKKIFKVIVYIFAAIGFIFVAAYLALELGLTKTKGIVDTQHDYFQDQMSAGAANSFSSSTLAWTQTEEWSVLKEAIVKDTAQINSASQISGIRARLIVAPLVVEQMRLFTSEREVYKAIFAPLKILGTQSQFSWGVMGIKQDTAKQIELSLTDSTSPWYLGSQDEHLLDYPATTTDIDAARFARLTDEEDRSYSYLYGAIYIKELETQWSKAGIDISNQPDIVATLFNIGFQNSKPHANPESGGAAIDIASTTYSFGSLAQSFYDSDELAEQFPK